jgi:hypothetical protein
LNSRMKDFYDIWLLSRQFDFKLNKLSEAVRLTFEQRGTKLEEPIDAFTDAFITDRQTIWTAFLKRLKQEHIPENFEDIVAEIRAFMKPVIDRETNDLIWQPAGPWKQ